MFEREKPERVFVLPAAQPVQGSAAMDPQYHRALGAPSSAWPEPGQSGREGKTEPCRPQLRSADVCAQELQRYSYSTGGS